MNILGTCGQQVQYNTLCPDIRKLFQHVDIWVQQVKVNKWQCFRSINLTTIKTALYQFSNDIKKIKLKLVTLPKIGWLISTLIDNWYHTPLLLSYYFCNCCCCNYFHIVTHLPVVVVVVQKAKTLLFQTGLEWIMSGLFFKYLQIDWRGQILAMVPHFQDGSRDFIAAAG